MNRELSPREEEILMLVTQGLTNREIANRLGISWRTVDAYLRRVYRKINVRGRIEAVVWYMQHEKGDVPTNGEEST